MVETMKEYIMSFATGLAVGIVFALIKLPIPAPPVLSGVISIAAITIGYMIVNKFI